jgi:hypothetical protein
MLPGYQEVRPLVFSGIYPVETSDFEKLKAGMGKLQLNDSAFSFQAESSMALVLALAFAIPCWSQQLIRTYEEVCSDIDWLPDLDKDGVPEILLGHTGYDRPFRDAGLARIVSVRSGVTLREHHGSGAGAAFGNPVGRDGDTDGDGVADYAVDSGVGSTIVYSGADGAVLMELPFSCASIAPLGDLNRDGFADFVLGRPFAFAGGEALVFEGGSFALRLHVVAPPEGFYFGAAVLGLDDVNGDEVPDFAVGAPALAMDFTVGRAYVFSGADGRLIHDIGGVSCLDEFGRILADVGDLTGDGVADIAIAAHIAGGTSCLFGGHGRVYYHDAVTGRRLGLSAVADPASVWVGQVMAGVGDLDGNGYGDLLVRHYQVIDRTVHVRALDGNDRSIVFQIDKPPGFVFAQKLVGVGDWTGDDFPEFLACTTGFIDLYSSVPPGVRVLCEACVFGGGEPPASVRRAGRSSGGASRSICRGSRPARRPSCWCAARSRSSAAATSSSPPTAPSCATPTQPSPPWPSA